MPRLQIENYREQPPSMTSNVLAIFDIYLPELRLVLRNFKMLKKKDGGKMISIPSFSAEIGGVKKWFPYIEFSATDQRDFLNNIWECIGKFINNTPPPPAPSASALLKNDIIDSECPF